MNFSVPPPLWFDPVRPRRVLAVNPAGPEAFFLTVERRSDRPRAGQHCSLGLPGSESRPYSLASAETAPHLEFLIRRVRHGRVSSQLAVLAPSDQVRLESPQGRFTLAAALPDERLLFVATGTGIAPFLSFLRTRPDLDATLIHGIRHPVDDFAAAVGLSDRRILCVSGSEVPPGAFAGRVSAWLDQNPPSVYHRAYLCGNAKMILEVFPRLADAGIPEDRIHTETYF